MDSSALHSNFSLQLHLPSTKYCGIPMLLIHMDSCRQDDLPSLLNSGKEQPLSKTCRHGCLPQEPSPPLYAYASASAATIGFPRLGFFLVTQFCAPSAGTVFHTLFRPPLTRLGSACC